LSGDSNKNKMEVYWQV